MSLLDGVWCHLQHRPRWQQHSVQLIIVLLIAFILYYYLLMPAWIQWSLTRTEVMQGALRLPLVSQQQLAQWTAMGASQDVEQIKQQWQQFFVKEADQENTESLFWLASLAQSKSRLQRWQRISVNDQGEWLQQAWRIEIIGQYQGVEQILTDLARRKELLVLDQIEIEGAGEEVLLKMILSRYWPKEESQ